MGNYACEARSFCRAIKALSHNEDAMNNLENYLSHHFESWLNKFASTPCGIAMEMTYFAAMHEYISEEK